MGGHVQCSPLDEFPIRKVSLQKLIIEISGDLAGLCVPLNRSFACLRDPRAEEGAENPSKPAAVDRP